MRRRNVAAIGGIAMGWATLWMASGADAAVLKADTLGCKAPADAMTAATLRAKKDMAKLSAFSRPLIAARTCVPFVKGVTIGIDEEKAPLTCVRLSGDLDCYWVPAALVDQFPGQGGNAGGRPRGGHRQH